MNEYRDYWESAEERPRFRFGLGFTPTVKALIVIEVAVFLAVAILGSLSKRLEWTSVRPGSIQTHLALSADGLIGHFRVWQLVTYQFLHDQEQLLHIVFNLFILYLFGPLVEQRIGGRKFLFLFLGAGLLGGLAYAIPNLFLKPHVPVLGASGSVMGVIVAGAFLFPTLTVNLFLVFPMRLMTLAILLVVLDLVGAVFVLDSQTAFSAHLGGALFGFLFVRWEAGVSGFFFRIERRMAAREKRQKIETRQRVDELLDKIHREGMDGLSRAERSFLKRASQEYKEGG